jgi:PAS domain S-box-containing protein
MPYIDFREDAENPAYAQAVMRATLEATADGILAVDQQGRITTLNTKFLEMWRMPQQLVHLRDVQKFGAFIAQQLKNPERHLARIAEIEVSRGKSFDLLEMADGSSIERYSDVILIGERVVGRVWSFRDVTQRQELDFISRHLAAIVDNSDDAIVGKDLNSIITSWNKGAERIFGYSANEMIGTSIMVLIPSDLQSEEEEILARLTRGERYDHFETIRLTKDRRRIHVSLTISPIKDANGSVVGVSKIARDITDRKRAEEALRASEERLREAQTELAHVSQVTTMGELAASITHEVNQPLAGIETNATAGLRWLVGDSPNLAEAREAIRRIIRDANRAGDVISRMRALFQRAPPTKERLHINEAIEEVVMLIQNEVRRNKVTLRTELAADLPSVIGDRVQLEQVVVNLILNAIEAMSAVENRERDLVIRTQRGERDEVRVVVRDSGIGFDPLDVERIFAAFHTSKPCGMGMGLAISRSILEAHGGRLWATPNADLGATFQFILPVQT